MKITWGSVLCLTTYGLSSYVELISYYMDCCTKNYFICRGTPLVQLGSHFWFEFYDDDSIFWVVKDFMAPRRIVLIMTMLKSVT